MVKLNMGGSIDDFHLQLDVETTCGTFIYSRGS